ncbi:MAG: GNAT family N-acetyltransferase [Pseudomonadota bacterium]
MTPAALAALHARAFNTGWTAQAFTDLLDSPTTHLFTAPNAFLLARIIAPEAEVLTLAVAQEARRQGRARALVAQLSAAEGVEEIFLEVAEDNAAARALYAACGFAEVGRRRAYYARAGGAVDAVLMRWAAAPVPAGSAGGIG